jgi:hypothetical protein
MRSIAILLSEFAISEPKSVDDLTPLHGALCGRKQKIGCAPHGRLCPLRLEANDLSQRSHIISASRDA